MHALSFIVIGVLVMELAEELSVGRREEKISKGKLSLPTFLGLQSTLAMMMAFM